LLIGDNIRDKEVVLVGNTAYRQLQQYKRAAVSPDYPYRPDYEMNGLMWIAVLLSSAVHIVEQLIMLVKVGVQSHSSLYIIHKNTFFISQNSRI
jgi:hypothetical protein